MDIDADSGQNSQEVAVDSEAVGAVNATLLKPALVVWAGI
jgi:hypothetical protein